METQQSLPSYTSPPAFSPPLKQPRSVDMVKPDIMEIEHVALPDRSQRGTSVLSGLSADDLEAAETLKSLGQGNTLPLHSILSPCALLTGQKMFIHHECDKPRPLTFRQGARTTLTSQNLSCH